MARLAARLCLIVIALTAVMAGNMLRLDPFLGVSQSDYARAIAAETDPVAKLLLIRSHLCNPDGTTGKDGVAHEHCEGCCVTPSIFPAPRLAALVQPVDRQRALALPPEDKRLAQVNAFERPPGRAPPAFG